MTWLPGTALSAGMERAIAKSIVLLILLIKVGPGTQSPPKLHGVHSVMQDFNHWGVHHATKPNCNFG